MSNLLPSAPALMACTAHRIRSESACNSQSAGHGMFPLQERASAATPSRWRDALVVGTSGTGWVALELVGNGQILWAWNHCADMANLRRGTPVALHGRYHVLAHGKERFNVLVTEADRG